ncbi:aminotransferase class I/II-fold pyridoxal phosphate-dependent enzyme [Candidatus Gottesmanbacteria bacterium]|nr:aminotransferase class I/II-fold pyridoxal phosphate-dependent enzyme [Candidatus Gottesmanbacteria bacterium]
MRINETHRYHPKNMFGVLPAAEHDKILHTKNLYDADPRKEKINAGIGVINDDKGDLWIPKAVRSARRRIVDKYISGLLTHNYMVPSGKLEWGGNPDFIRGTANLVFGEYAHELLASNRIAATGTVGGSGAVSTFLEALKERVKSGKPVPAIIYGSKHYPNHEWMIDTRGFKSKTFAQIKKDGSYNLEETLKAVNEAKPGSVLFLQGGAHNPTGINPETEEQWRTIAKTAKKNKIDVFFDIPYAGLNKGLDEDTKPLRIFMDENVSVAVAVSYSKNAGLYGERVGALLVPAANANEAKRVGGLLNRIMRNTVSSPSAFGEAIIAEIFNDPILFARWKKDLSSVSRMLHKRRELLAQSLPENIGPLIRKGAGIFSTIPISEKAVNFLRKEYAIYVLGNGRINIGGISTDQIPRFALALNAALRKYPIIT